jgi:hypothetical protein
MRLFASSIIAGKTIRQGVLVWIASPLTATMLPPSRNDEGLSLATTHLFVKLRVIGPFVVHFRFPEGTDGVTVALFRLRLPPVAFSSLMRNSEPFARFARF